MSKEQLQNEMEYFHDTIVESDGRIRLKSAVHLVKGLKVLVAVPHKETDSAISGIGLSEPSLADDWLNTEADDAWAHPLPMSIVSDCESYAIQLLRQLPIKDLGIKVVFLELLERTVSSHEKVAESLSGFPPRSKLGQERTSWISSRSHSLTSAANMSLLSACWTGGSPLPTQRVFVLQCPSKPEKKPRVRGACGMVLGACNRRLVLKQPALGEAP
jgi:hypothetical protein